MLDMVSDSNRTFILKLLVNKGFRIIVRTYSGFPFYNYSLIRKKRKELVEIAEKQTYLRFQSLFVIFSEILFIPLRIVRKRTIVKRSA